MVCVGKNDREYGLPQLQQITNYLILTSLPTAVIPKLWPAGYFWPAASYKMARQYLWSRIFYLQHISV